MDSKSLSKTIFDSDTYGSGSSTQSHTGTWEQMSCTHDVSTHLDEDTGNSISSCSKSIFMGTANSLLQPIYDVTRTVRSCSHERIAEALNVWPYSSTRHLISTLMEREMLLLLFISLLKRIGACVEISRVCRCNPQNSIQLPL